MKEVDKHLEEVPKFIGGWLDAFSEETGIPVCALRGEVAKWLIRRMVEDGHDGCARHLLETCLINSFKKERNYLN